MRKEEAMVLKNRLALMESKNPVVRPTMHPRMPDQTASSQAPPKNREKPKAPRKLPAIFMRGL